MRRPHGNDAVKGQRQQMRQTDATTNNAVILIQKTHLGRREEGAGNGNAASPKPAKATTRVLQGQGGLEGKEADTQDVRRPCGCETQIRPQRHSCIAVQQRGGGTSVNSACQGSANTRAETIRQGRTQMRGRTRGQYETCANANQPSCQRYAHANPSHRKTCKGSSTGTATPDGMHRIVDRADDRREMNQGNRR